MPRSARKVLVIVLLVQVAWSLPLAVVMGNLWLTTDEPNRSYACSDGGTCYSGPTTYLIMTLVFGGIAVAVLVAMGVMLTRWRRRAGLRAHLLANGVRVPALLVDVVPTNTEINDRRLYKLVFESRSTGRPLRVVERSLALLPIGTPTTIVHDPADPSRAVLVEDVESLTADAHQHVARAHQAHVDAMFAQQSAAPAPEQTGLGAMRDAVARNLETALAELRQQVETGQLTQAAYEQQRDQWMRLLETRSDRPLG
jgi:uncharacterized protein DUF3592